MVNGKLGNMKVDAVITSSSIDQLDAELLLAHILHKDRSWIVAHPEYNLSDKECDDIKNVFERRKNNEPIAYIIGEREFYGRSFFVDRNVLIPRSCTEFLVEQTLSIAKNGGIQQSSNEIDTEITATTDIWKDETFGTIVDIGTGSGCIAITLALEIPNMKIIATDISQEALEVAERNAEKHTVFDRIDFRLGSYMDPVQNLDENFLIVSNPPYIPQDEKLMEDVGNYEPHSALFANNSGKEIVNQIVTEAKKHSRCVGFVIESRCDTIRT